MEKKNNLKARNKERLAKIRNLGNLKLETPNSKQTLVVCGVP